MLSPLKGYVLKNEEWLIERVLSYARERNFTKYTSTLQEAWRLSISGLSASLIEVLNIKGSDLELEPDEDYTNDPASVFGIIEANKHRKRGITLEMFLGLMKYYRQSYSDLIIESDFEIEMKLLYNKIVGRYFDRVEIGFCMEWLSAKNRELVKELQDTNREMTNEKNEYLTIFESLSMPVFIVGPDGTIGNMNHAAAGMLNFNNAPGAQYYGKNHTDRFSFIDKFPWLRETFTGFTYGEENRISFEKEITESGDGECHFFISFSRSLDISGRFSDTIVIIEDITKRKLMEKRLERLATTDPLTKALNRRSFIRFFEQELERSKRYNKNCALLMMDIDNFKKINDTYGHNIGDKTLKLLVQRSASVLRTSDIFGRWGGEEFIIFLPETDLQQALFAAERLREVLSKSELNADDGSVLNFTVSIGLSMIKESDRSIDELIKQADDALFMAKKQGKNRVVSI